MKPVLRYQSQLLYRKSYKPIRGMGFRPGAKPVTYRPQVVWRNDSYAVDVRHVHTTSKSASKAA